MPHFSKLLRKHLNNRPLFTNLRKSLRKLDSNDEAYETFLTWLKQEEAVSTNIDAIRETLSLIPQLASFLEQLHVYLAKTQNENSRLLDLAISHMEGWSGHCDYFQATAIFASIIQNTQNKALLARCRREIARLSKQIELFSTQDALDLTLLRRTLNALSQSIVHAGAVYGNPITPSSASILRSLELNPCAELNSAKTLDFETEPYPAQVAPCHWPNKEDWAIPLPAHSEREVEEAYRPSSRPSR